MSLITTQIQNKPRGENIGLHFSKSGELLEIQKNRPFYGRNLQVGDILRSVESNGRVYNANLFCLSKNNMAWAKHTNGYFKITVLRCLKRECDDYTNDSNRRKKIKLANK